MFTNVVLKKNRVWFYHIFKNISPFKKAIFGLIYKPSKYFFREYFWLMFIKSLNIFLYLKRRFVVNLSNFWRICLPFEEILVDCWTILLFFRRIFFVDLSILLHLSFLQRVLPLQYFFLFHCCVKICIAPQRGTTSTNAILKSLTHRY